MTSKLVNRYFPKVEIQHSLKKSPTTSLRSPAIDLAAFMPVESSYHLNILIRKQRRFVLQIEMSKFPHSSKIRVKQYKVHNIIIETNHISLLSLFIRS